MPERDKAGRFPAGVSGNRRGRPRKTPKRLETPFDLNEIIIDVMNMPTIIRTAAGEETMTLFKATLLSIATGNTKNRIASDRALQMFRAATWERWQHMSVEERRRFRSEPGHEDDA